MLLCNSKHFVRVSKYLIFITESSSIVIALISSPYIRSKVCQEEYNLASAMHADPSYETKLLPLLVEDVEALPIWCRGYTPIDCRNISDYSMMKVLEKVNLLLGTCHVS